MTNYDGEGRAGEAADPQNTTFSGPINRKNRRKRRRGSRGRRNASRQPELQHNPLQADAAVSREAKTLPPELPCAKELDAEVGLSDRNPGNNKACPRHPGTRKKGGAKLHPAGRFRDRPAYAALDLGTNNCRLLVAVPNGTSFRVIDAFSRIVRLGEGIANSGRLSDDAMGRAVDALKVCAMKLKGRNIKRLRLIATEACRIAENGEEFIARVRAEAGLELEIVNRETEARLAVSGCAPLVDRHSDGVILFDIGGGSSELVWLDLKDRAHARSRISKRVRTWTSLPVGVVNISERHGGVHVTPPVFEGMVEEVMGLLDDFPEAAALSEMVAKGEVHMLGTSGTVTTLAGVHLGLDFYDRRRVDGIWMSGNDVGAMTQRLLGMSFEERSNNACIGKERADLVLAGCAILEALRRKWPCNRLRVADRGLREGILYELMNEDGVLRTGKQSARKGEDKSHNKPRNRCRRPPAGAKPPIHTRPGDAS